MGVETQIDDKSSIKRIVVVEDQPAQSNLKNAKVIEDSSQPLSILKRFLEVGSSAQCELSYKHLVNLLKQLHNWSGQQRSEYIEHFIDDADLFDSRTGDMVNAFCMLEWRLIAKNLRNNFIRFLRDIATFNPFHLENVLLCIAQNCLNVFGSTEQKVESESELSKDEREVMFEIGLESIYSLISKNSPRLPMLVSLLENKMKVHKSAPLSKCISYIRLLLTLADYYPRSSRNLWFCIVDFLFKIDAELSTQRSNDVFQLFPRREDTFIDESLHPIRDKLDACMIMILCYTSLGSENPTIKPEDYEFTKWMEGMKPSKDLFSTLMLSFEAQVLFFHEIEHVPFIWFYICSESRDILVQFLKHLWRIMTTSYKTPNNWKKAHNAATFMAGLLARAEFVDIELAHYWLRQMIEWAINYVNELGQVKFHGGARHGTFYTIVQAAFFLLCFRHSEFNKILEEIRLLGIPRIVYSKLEPLNFILKPLAVFFARISRQMQLVYCNHIVNMNSGDFTIEASFPFLRLGLVECGKHFQPNLRVFISEEKDELPLHDVQSVNEVLEDEDYGFMDEEDGI